MLLCVSDLSLMCFTVGVRVVASYVVGGSVLMGDTM